MDIHRQSATAQAEQAGYNNDFIGYASLPYGSDSSDRGLLCVSYEYTDPHMMYPGFTGAWTPELVAVDMAAHGMGVIEVRRESNGWRYVQDSPYNRRITAQTPMTIAGPVAGHPWLQTTADPAVRLVLGTLNNCAGGMTPWGTWLQAEENFHSYFRGDLSAMADQRQAQTCARYGVSNRSWRGWDTAEPRFDLDHEPHEINRFGWVVEVDLTTQ